MNIKANYLFLAYHLPNNHGEAKEILQDILQLLSTQIPNTAYI